MGHPNLPKVWAIAKRATPLAFIAGAFVTSTVATRRVHADGVDQVALHERCAIRLSSALVGTSPSAALSAGDPQSQVDAVVASPEFIERFSRFINAKFNEDPGATPAEDATYYLAKEILSTGKPWKDMFVGAYTINAGQGMAAPTVAADPNGLGYFNSTAWTTRYAGNEPAGIRIVAAYRILNNTVGLKLLATTNAPGADISANGRQAAACKSCHYDGWSALDDVAGVLGTIRRQGQAVTVQPYTGGAKALFSGTQQIKDQRELVNALVASENFSFNACALAFQYLYGRRENVCESPTFDKCVETFKSTGMIQHAVASVAKDATFCD